MSVDRVRLRGRLRAEALAAYGGRCRCCGETHEVMLCLDHVFENGSRDRRVGRGQGVKFLQALKVEGWPPDIQILCYNCNTAKSRLGKCRTRTRLFRRAHWLW